jgi:hypothetical protein
VTEIPQRLDDSAPAATHPPPRFPRQRKRKHNGGIRITTASGAQTETISSQILKFFFNRLHSM